MYDVSLKRKWDAESIRETAIIEQERARQEGLEKGLEKGLERKSYEVVENLILKLELSDQQIAEVTEVSLDFVEKVRKELAKNKK